MSETEQPLTPVASADRAPNGRFVRGNKAAAGNPANAKAQRLRNELLAAVSGKDCREVIKKLVEMAKAGDVPAAKLLFDRVLGQAEATSKISVDSEQTTVVEVVFDGNWYGNETRIREAIAENAPAKQVITAAMSVETTT